MDWKKSVVRILITAVLVSFSSIAKADVYKDNKIPKNIRSEIEKIVDAPSHLDGIDDFKRKPREERINDNIKWYKKYGKVNNLYNRYCLDVKGFGNQDDFVSFRRQENCDVSKIIFSVDDKLSLYSAVQEKYKKLNTTIYFKFRGEKILNFKYAKIKNCSNTRAALKKLPNGKYFIKPQGGLQGSNAIALTKKGKNFNFTHVTKGTIDLEQFLENTKSQTFFVQAYIEQHEDLKALNPSTLNTIRIITTKFNDKPQILCAGLRMGKNSKTIVDNASKGGCFVGINTKTGTLKKYGFFENARAVKEHPESKIKFEDYQIPFWQECVEAAKKLHSLCPGYTSIGWDIAITPEGPILVEGNSEWGWYIPNLTCRGIRRNWERNKKI